MHSHTILHKVDQRTAGHFLGLVRTPIEHLKQGGQHSEVKHRLPQVVCKSSSKVNSFLCCSFEQTFWEQRAKDMGRRWCDEVVELFDQFEQCSKDGPRFHSRPADF